MPGPMDVMRKKLFNRPAGPGLMGSFQQQMMQRPKPGIALANRGLMPFDPANRGQRPPAPVAPAMPVKQRIGKPSPVQFKRGPMMY